MSVYELIKKRRTVRKFKSGKIELKQIEKYIEAARVAPSAMNLQPIKYISVTSEKAVEEIFKCVKLAGYLGGNYTKENEKPAAFIAVCIDKNLSCAFSEFDLGAAIQNIVLTALEDGVGSCTLGAVNKEKVNKILELPENLELNYMIALGIPAEQPKEVEVKNNDIKYYLEGETLCVPKRELKEILIKNI